MWQAMWVGEKNQILHCAWLPKWARWCHLTCCVQQENSVLFSTHKSLTDHACLDIGPVLFSFLHVYRPQLCLSPWTCKKKRTRPIFSHLDWTSLVNNRHTGCPTKAYTTMLKGIMGNGGFEAVRCFSISQTRLIMLPFPSCWDTVNLNHVTVN